VPQVKKVLILSLIFILLLGMSAHGTFSLFSDTETSTGNQFTAWIEECVCAKFNISNDKGSIDKIFKYDASGTLAGSFDLASGNSSSSGVASTTDYLYVLDQADKQVYKYNCCGDLLGTSKVLQSSSGSSPGNPFGLAIYGNELWILAWGQNFILYRYSLSDAFSGSGTINANLQVAYDPANTNPTGLSVDDTNYIYVLDSVDEQFYRYPHPDGSYVGNQVVASKVLRNVSGGAIETPVGAMLDGTSLWIVTDNFPNVGMTCPPKTSPGVILV